MRSFLIGLVFCSACGIASSGAGAPANAPASGLGPIVPLEDSKGLSWTAPFLLADPARALSHPSALVEADRLELWAQSDKGGDLTIVFARAESFEKGMGSLEEALRAEAPWEGGAVGAPAVLRREGATLLLYLAGGKIGCARLEGGRAAARASAPVHADAGGGVIRSIAFGAAGARVRGFALVEGPGDPRIDLLEGSFDELLAAASDLPGSTDRVRLRAHPIALPLPGWAVAVTELGLRLERTPAGRLREDLFFAATLPQLVDLGAPPPAPVEPPTAIGAASRYLDESASVEAPLEVVPAPVLSGPPFPGSATAVAYGGGVLILYSARSGPRSAIGVGRHP